MKRSFVVPFFFCILTLVDGTTLQSSSERGVWQALSSAAGWVGDQIPLASAVKSMFSAGSAPVNPSTPAARPVDRVLIQTQAKRSNGQCECKDDESELAKKCPVQNAHLEHAPSSPIGTAPLMSGDQAIKTFGQGLLTEAQKKEMGLAEVLQTTFTCMDGRVEEHGVATPGGDLGEFITALAAYQIATGGGHPHPPSAQEVESFLSQYLQSLPAGRRMVLCTDEQAVSNVQAAFKSGSLDLANPQGVNRDNLLAALAQPNNNGDTHLKRVLKAPSMYNLPPALAGLVIQTFYKLLWIQNGDKSSPFFKSQKLQLMVLKGQADPKAFIEVSQGKTCISAGITATLKQNRGDMQVIISNLDAVDVRRQEIALFFAKAAGQGSRAVTWEKMRKGLNVLGIRALAITGKEIALGLPFYELSYN